MGNLHFKRGQIIYVDFGTNIGSELNGPHYAIVLTKNDNNKNDILTVLPLSSKKKDYYLPLGQCVYKAAYDVIKNKVLILAEELSKQLDIVNQELTKSIVTTNSQKIKELNHSIKCLNKEIEKYKNKHVESFGMILNITSISKRRIIIAKNAYDPIRKMKVTSKELDKIDNAIIENLTNAIVNKI